MSGSRIHAPEADGGHPKAPEKPTSAAPFRLGDFTFQCWLIDEAGGRYEWRSVCGRLAVGHAYADRALWPAGPRDEPEAWAVSMAARRYIWAAVDGARTRDRFADLASAMRGAITALAAKRFGPIDRDVGRAA